MDLNDAIETERDRRKREKDAAATKRASAMQALRGLYDRCRKAGLPNWEFRFSDGELIALHSEGLRDYGNKARHVWQLDDQNRITDGRYTTASVDSVGGASAVDEAIRAIAKMVLDADEPNG